MDDTRDFMLEVLKELLGVRDLPRQFATVLLLLSSRHCRGWSLPQRSSTSHNDLTPALALDLTASYISKVCRILVGIEEMEMAKQ
jgi:hypothetical protein